MRSWPVDDFCNFHGFWVPPCRSHIIPTMLIPVIPIALFNLDIVILDIQTSFEERPKYLCMLVYKLSDTWRHFSVIVPTLRPLDSSIIQKQLDIFRDLYFPIARVYTAIELVHPGGIRVIRTRPAGDENAV